MCTDGTVLNKLGCCGTLMKGKPDKTHPYHMCTARSSSGIDIGGFKYTCKSKNKETWILTQETKKLKSDAYFISLASLLIGTLTFL